jgi:dihydrodipicolinate synthase/N-acetylneuraminate lyase
MERCAGKRVVLVPTGSTGEAYALSDSEQLKVIETVIDCVAGQLPVVAGAAAAGTDRTIERARAAENAGADGVQVVLPYYHVPSDEGLVRHFLRLADALRIGVVIYNNSAVSKLWMPPHLMARCAEHPNIIADKENTSDVKVYKTMRDAIDPAKMTVLCGLGDLQFAYTAALGCPGFVSMTANFAPELSLALLEAADACDFLRVRDIMVKIAPLYEFAGSLCAAPRPRPLGSARLHRRSHLRRCPESRHGHCRSRRRPRAGSRRRSDHRGAGGIEGPSSRHRSGLTGRVRFDYQHNKRHQHNNRRTMNTRWIAIVALISSLLCSCRSSGVPENQAPQRESSSPAKDASEQIKKSPLPN